MGSAVKAGDNDEGLMQSSFKLHCYSATVEAKIARRRWRIRCLIVDRGKKKQKISNR